MQSLPHIRFRTAPLFEEPFQTDLLVVAEPVVIEYRDWVCRGPAGTFFDGASIPRVPPLLWTILGPPMRTRLRPGALFHDLGYKGELGVFREYPGVMQPMECAPLSRAVCDEALYHIGVWNGYPRWKAALALWGVRTFGRGPWRREHERQTHQRAKNG